MEKIVDSAERTPGVHVPYCSMTAVFRIFGVAFVQGLAKFAEVLEDKEL